MKLKHNKKRNTAFLYETLMRELTKTIVNKNEKQKEKVVLIIKEHFNNNSLLSRELKLYNALDDSYNLDPHTAEKLIFEVKKEYFNIDKKELFVEQTVLVDKLNKIFSKSIFSNFVPNYKNLATIYQIFNNETPVKKRVLLEQNIFKRLTFKTKEKIGQMKPINNLVYQSFIKRFNEKYSDKLLKEQRVLLNKYVTSFVDNGIELKIFLNEEIGRLKKYVSSSLNSEEMKNDSEMLKKTKDVLKILESFRKERIGKKLVNKVLQIQNLVEEIKN